MSIKKFIEKKIIEKAPFSVEYDHDAFPDFFRAKVRAVDARLQNWALLGSDFFSADDWQEIQLVKLKKLLVHAGTNVPYWRELFWKIGFDPQRISHARDIERIPMLTRAELKKIPQERLLAENIPKWRFIEASTSGSTGEPLRFFQDARDVFRRFINTNQEFRYAGTGHEPLTIVGLRKHHDLDDAGTSFSIWDLENPETRHTRIYPHVTQNPSVLVTAGSIVRRIAFFAQYDDIRPLFSKIFYRGEFLSDRIIRELSSFFNCQLFTTYGTRECSLLGIECERHVLHQAPWMNLTEVVGMDGARKAHGDVGDIVVTFFENYAMPIIRYRIGDTGNSVGQACRCGRSSPVIKLFGRRSMFIRVAGEKSIPLTVFTKHIDENYSDKIFRYQFLQKDPRLLVFRYVPMEKGQLVEEEAIREMEKGQLVEEEAIRDSFTKCTYHKVRVEVEAADVLYTTSDGKTLPLVTESFGDSKASLGGSGAGLSENPER